MKTVSTPHAQWVRYHGKEGPDCWHLRCKRNHCQPLAATVWDNGTWHTWDQSGVGGENSVEETVERAKIEASASAIAQGFI